MQEDLSEFQMIISYVLMIQISHAHKFTKKVDSLKIQEEVLTLLLGSKNNSISNIK
jgi:hypothetical protein